MMTSTATIVDNSATVIVDEDDISSVPFVEVNRNQMFHYISDNTQMNEIINNESTSSSSSSSSSVLLVEHEEQSSTTVNINDVRDNVPLTIKDNEKANEQHSTSSDSTDGDNRQSSENEPPNYAKHTKDIDDDENKTKHENDDDEDDDTELDI
jgi:hypothetical protein